MRTHDGIERRVVESMDAACSEEDRARLGLFLERDGGVLLSGATGEGSILLNRAFVPGGAAVAEQLAWVTSVYRRRGVERFFVHLHEADCPDAAVPEGAGLRRARRWRQFERDVGPCQVTADGMEVRRIDGEHAGAFAAIVAGAFGLGEAATPWLSGLVDAPGWHVYVAFDGGEPAGCGALLREGAHGWLGFGATRPAFRRRGVQRALLSARIEAARAAGCERLFTETGEAVPGEGQHSYRNIVRVGFVEGPLRDNWAPSGR